MNNFRNEQVQNIILKSTKKTTNSFKLKEAEEGEIDVALFESGLKNLIAAEEYIYKSLPNHHLDKEDATVFTKFLIDARESINEQLSNFKVIEQEVEEFDLSKLTSNILFITPKNNFKKSLKKLGIDVSNIVVADMPLVIEDMKEINPKIPDAALKGIEKKIEHIHNDIKRKIDSINPEKIIVLGEKDKNGELLAKRATEHYSAQIHLDENLKELTDIDIKNIIEQ